MQKFSAIIDQLREPATVSRMPSVRCPAITRPTSDEECRALREWAQTVPTVPPQPASIDQLTKHLQFLAAALPSKNVDDLNGKMKASVYASLLGGYSNDALAFMARTACATLDWFPTPRQCLDLISAYRPPVSDQETALRLCQDYQTEQFDRWFANVSAGQPIGDVPEQWQRIAIERGVLRRLPGGTIVIRARYHGPFKIYQAAEAKAA